MHAKDLTLGYLSFGNYHEVAVLLVYLNDFIATYCAPKGKVLP
jgi:hypothetical protein